MAATDRPKPKGEDAESKWGVEVGAGKTGTLAGL